MPSSLCFIVLDENESDNISESKFSFERFSVTRPHQQLEGFSKLQICLVCVFESDKPSSMYLALVRSKQAVATTTSRVKLVLGRRIFHCSAREIESRIDNELLKRKFRELCDNKGISKKLSNRLGRYVLDAIKSLDGDVLRSIVRDRDGRKSRTLGERLESTVLYDAMSIFGVNMHDEADHVFSNISDESAIGSLKGPAWLLEDRVIEHDARDMPGWDMVRSDMTGLAEFTKGNIRLSVFTANRGLVEKATGADLIYINNVMGNAVLIQYKMLDPENRKSKNRFHSKKWVYRPDNQYRDEVNRMRRMKLTPNKRIDYRLNNLPFYFKFVRRIEKDMSNAGFVISLDHLESIVSLSKKEGSSRLGKVDYDVLRGRYLRKADVIGLIRSGYIGTSAVDTKMIENLIAYSLYSEKRTSVIAYQDLIGED